MLEINNRDLKGSEMTEAELYRGLGRLTKEKSKWKESITIDIEG